MDGKMILYLIGLPGVGKSTIGKALSQTLNYEYVDMDTYIEQKAMLFVDEIFHLYGEPYFRALETEVLKELSNKENLVIACGGGIVKNLKNKALMKGTCIYLTAPTSEIEKRLVESNIERPLLATKTLNDLYFERKALYDNFKDLEVENIDVETTIQKILGGLNIS